MSIDTQDAGFMGAILAAGRGTRMAPFTDHYPKPILPICNKPLIEYQIELMRSVGIRDILVLVGHKGFEITKVLGEGRHLGVSLRYVEQTDMLGIAHAVGRLEPYTRKPFLLFLGDIFFVPGDLTRLFGLFREQGGGAVLATKDEADPEAIRRNFSVVLSDDGYVRRVIEKPRYTTNRLKGVGIYLFDLSIFDAIRRTPRTAMRDEYEITEAIQVMIDDGQPVRAAEVVLEDVNLTNPTDVLAINLRVARGRPQTELIGEECRLHPGVRIENSVIGSRVTIAHPILVRNSIILADTAVETDQPIENAVVTPGGLIPCGPAVEPAEID
jgi:dTDP-glucose pyrophosphorylase